MVENLKKNAYIASIWLLGGHGVHMVLRLGSNLILTRLLVPEFFGIMAIALVVIRGMELFSDVGIRPGVIRSNRSDDPSFLNTAWTIQVIRGMCLSFVTITIAKPVADIYENPILAEILPVVGLVFIISSFSSTSIFTLNKKVQLGALTVMDIVSQLIGISCMILLAYFYRNVWALIVGTITTAIIKSVWSHLLQSGDRNRFALEKESVSEIISFGKWIFASTAMMFLATQADRFLLGKMLPIAVFGIYHIAVMFAELPKQIIEKLSSRIIFPLMTHFADLPRQEFRKKIIQKRYMLLFPLILLLSLFSSFGDILIAFLYDDRYQQAGWMLPLLAIGMWPFVLNATIDRCFYAIGKPKIPTIGSFLKFAYMIVVVPIMFDVLGTFGAVLAVAMNDLPVYVVNSIGLQREGLACFRQDTISSLLLVLLIGIFFVVRLFLDMGIPGRSLLVAG